MPLLDIIILAVLALSAFLGYRRGLIGQIGSIAAIVAGVVVCRLFAGQVVDMVAPGSAEGSDFSSYAVRILVCAVLYIAAYYAVILIAKLLKFAVKAVLLGPLDSIAGAIVSMAKWMLGLSLALNLWIALFPSRNPLEHSTLFDGKAADAVAEFAPKLLGAISPMIASENNGSGKNVEN